MILAFALLLACQLAGEMIARSIGLPVPGPVIGFALLATGLSLHARRTGAPPEAIETTDLGRVAAGLLGALGLLFVPVGVGVVQQAPLLGAWGLGIFVALLGSTLATLVVTASVFIAIKRWRAAREKSNAT